MSNDGGDIYCSLQLQTLLRIYPKRFALLIGKDRKTYALKEKGVINFSPKEMLVIRDEIKKI